jgi:hypothetical protein
VWYGAFASREDAGGAIKWWMQHYKVTRDEKAKDGTGRVIGERILGSNQNPQTHELEYLLIRQDALNYWRIQSTSRADAEQLDATIDASSLAR